MAKQKTVTLRPYQQTDKDAIEAAWLDYLGVIYQLPTGGGKSVIFTGLINDYKSEQIIVFAHKKKLLRQIKAHLANFGIIPGMLMGTLQENLDANILLVSIRSAVKAKRLEWLIGRNWDRVIIDEARHSRTGSYDIVLDRLREVHPQHKLLGVDATPFRKDKKRLDKHFQYMVKSCETVKSLQEKGYLCGIKTYGTKLGDIEKMVTTVANDYQQSQLSAYMRQPLFLKYAVDSYIKWGEGKQAIVFAVDKAHSKDLYQAFIDGGIKSIVRIDSDSSDAEIDAAYEGYEKGTIQMIINVEMVTEGVDLPETKVVVGVRPTKSLTLYLQMGGRLLRPKEDGSDGIMIDCCGWTEEFGTLNSPKEWSLDPEIDPNDPRKKNRIVGRDKEGKLTTDMSEIDEFSELIEMTPEEYIGRVQGGMKEAEKQNMTIDEKIKRIHKDLEELLHKAAMQGLKNKVSPFIVMINKDKYDDNQLTAKFVHKVRVNSQTINEEECVTNVLSDSHIAEMNLGKRNEMYCTLDSRIIDSQKWYRTKDPAASLKEFREMSVLCGEVNDMISDNKNLMMQILDKHQQAHDLELTKINLDEYKDLAKKYEKDQWRQSILDHFKAGNNIFILENSLSESDHFKGDKWSNDNIFKIEIPSGQINNYHNKIITHSAWRRSEGNQLKPTERNYVKGDKIYEMLENGNWNSYKETTDN
jgi:DNA repair protein RadD